MLKKLAESLARGGRREMVIPPEAQADPVGQQTAWAPLSHSGSNFQTHQLVLETPQTAVFTMTRGAKWFCGLLMFIGAFMLISWGANKIRSETWTFAEHDWGALLFVCIFGGIGFAMMRFMGRPVTFDKRSGYFWKGRTRPTDVFEPEELKNAARLEDIHALQVLEKLVQSSRSNNRSSSSFYCYELNVVLNDGKRINAVEHGNRAKLKEDAKQLAEFLGKPLWDAV
jgi:hypothetical protein